MLITLGSLKGAPGVTTCAVAVAAGWPAPARRVVIEADPAGGDLATRFGIPGRPGLLELAVAARRQADPMVVWQHAALLGGSLPVITAPNDPKLTRAALAVIAPNRAGGGVLPGAASTEGAVVIVDCGRLDPASPCQPILRAADVLVLLCHARAEDLLRLAACLPRVRRWSRRPVLLLVGEGYSSAEIARECGIEVLGRLPHDPRGAAGFAGQHSSAPRSALGRAAHTIATTLQPAPHPPHTAPAPPGPVGHAGPAEIGDPLPGSGIRVLSTPPLLTRSALDTPWGRGDRSR